MTRSLFEEFFPIIAGESDRGAILVGAELVTFQLGKLLVKHPSTQLKREEVKKLSLFERNRTARKNEIYGDGMHEIINELRNLRNHAAHTALAFSLKDHERRLDEILGLLGAGVPAALQQWAAGLLLSSISAKVVEAGANAFEEGEIHRAVTPEDVLERLAEMPDMVEILDSRLPKMRLAAAVILVCGVLAGDSEET